MFERYTEKARRAVFFARYEASQSGSPYIEPLHLLLGILHEGAHLFLSAGLSVSAVALAEDCRRALLPTGKKISVSVDLPLSNECRQALTNAAAEAEQMASEPITLQHLTLGVMKASSAVNGILNNHGITAEKLAAVQLSSPEQPGPPPGGTYTVSAAGPGSPFVEFLCRGERIGSTAARFANPLPRVGDEVVFRRDNGPQIYKVLTIKYHFEEPPKSKTPGHAWLAKIVIETERVDSLSDANAPVN